MKEGLIIKPLSYNVVIDQISLNYNNLKDFV